jgi:hypothetical protein
MKQDKAKLKSRNARRSILGLGNGGVEPETAVDKAAEDVLTSSETAEKQYTAPKKVSKIDDYIRKLSTLSAMPL